MAAGAGNWKIHGSVPLYATDHSKTRLRRTSGTAATLVVGQAVYSYSGGFVTTDSQLSGVVTLAAGDVLEVQAIVTTSGRIGNCCGALSSGENSVYTLLEFEPHP
jgi:hypothetical protein